MSKKKHKKKNNKKVLNGIDLINQSSTINNNESSENTDNQKVIVDNYNEEINNNINTDSDTTSNINDIKNQDNKQNDNTDNTPDDSNFNIKPNELKSEFKKQEDEIKKDKNIIENFNLVNEKNSDFKEIKKEKVNLNINEKIQSFISILFTVIIFLALILLIITLYKNNFSNNNNSCDKEKVCQEYIKKDYNINTDEVIKFIKLNRGIFYTMQEFDNKTDLNTFITYYIWSREGEYLECSDDSNCLVTKKEIDETELLKAIKTYLNKDLKTLSFNTDFKDTDNIRLYKNNEKIVLTFKEFIYESLRHEIINTIVDENNIKVYLALLKNDNGNYDYVGYKEINLKYLNNNYIIESIKTNYAN